MKCQRLFIGIGFDISCKSSPKETICMKCQSLFSGKDKKNIIICHLLNLPRVVEIKSYPAVLKFYGLFTDISFKIGHPRSTYIVSIFGQH